MALKSLFTVIAVLLVSISAWATPIPNASIGAYDITYSGEYFTSEDNLSDKGGDTDPLPSGGSYTNFNNLVEVGYSMRPAFRFSVGGEFGLSESDNNFNSFSTSEFSNLIASAQYFYGESKLRIIPNIRVSFAINEIDPTSEDVLTGEGSHQYELGSWFRYPIWKLDNYAYMAYVYQEDDKADLLKWALGTKWYLKKWIFRGQINGVSTIVDDGFSEFQIGQRIGANFTASAGSLRYNSWNPEYIEAEAVAEYQYNEDTRFGGGVGQTITGKNYGFGLSIMLSFQTSFRMDGDKTEDAYRLDGSGFEPELEDYNEDLFR